MSLYKHAFDNLSFGVLIYDREGALLDANMVSKDMLPKIGLQKLLSMNLFSAPLLGMRAKIVRDQGLPFLQFEEQYICPATAGALSSYAPSMLTVLQVRLAVLNGEDQASVGFMAQLRDLTREKAAILELERRAFYDLLTGLPNRELFRDRLKQTISRAKRNRTRFAILFLDLDDFKSVNDSHGHCTGDSVLRETGRRIVSCLRASDTVARFGGDEFVVLLEGVGNKSMACLTAEKIREATEQEIQLHGIRVRTSVTVGIALYPSDGKTPLELITAADMDMYKKKKREPVPAARSLSALDGKKIP